MLIEPAQPTPSLSFSGAEPDHVVRIVAVIPVSQEFHATFAG